jgi:hypothetical protein
MPAFAGMTFTFVTHPHFERLTRLALLSEEPCPHAGDPEREGIGSHALHAADPEAEEGMRREADESGEARQPGPQAEQRDSPRGSPGLQ